MSVSIHNHGVYNRRNVDVQRAINCPQSLLGHKISHPDCEGVLLTIVKVNNPTNATWDGNGIWRNYLLVLCEDGEWYRYWLDSDMEIPKSYED